MRKALLTKAPEDFGAAPNDVLENKVVVARPPATQYLVLNSADRSTNANPNQGLNFIVPPWNNFRLQRPQALMEAFARRIQVSEVRFPWAIPNINPLTNSFYCKINNDTPFLVQFPNGFYTPSEFELEFNNALKSFRIAGFNAGYSSAQLPTMNWDDASQSFTWVGGTEAYQLLPFPTYTPAVLFEYRRTPSFLRVVGFPDEAINTSGTGAIEGNTTTLSYTDYIDIISDKLNYFSDVKDGSSGTTTATSLICRLYLADEVSLTSDVPKACRPFTIHRQFQNAKNIQWSPEAMIDWLDIRIEDQYGNLVPEIPSLTQGRNKIYPDFQITLLASES